MHLNSLSQRDEPALKQELKFVHPGRHGHVPWLRGWDNRLGDRHGDDKTAAFSRRALDPHEAAMRFDNPGHEAEAQAKSAFGARGVVSRHAIETVENVRHVIGSNSAAGVLDPKFHAAVLVL